jgi:hypothetical protein
MNKQEGIKESSLKEKYFSKADPDGYIYVGDFASAELKKQSKSLAALLDGEGGTIPEYNFGEGLKYKGNSGNYSDMKIHIDDVDTFVQRVKSHFGM